ncbi:TonB-dependent receptor [Novosphingobium sp. APW14]|uniref:TonB-dependent receptor n=1 Tax=Novosphingobium sp. APW14 TaxID=3077237 RepID=UPI0028DF74B4|nr:TonB-dependent receptor [Novosphingobium sp. APW14]MDT9013099.1 TonB-dependent receptor [Novosphingobium sp. APW14]
MKKHLIRAALLGAVALPVTAYAQEAKVEEAQPAPAAAETDVAEGNEIVVTATKREQTLQDVPVAVSVTTAETIERAQVRDLKDLQTLVPALRVSQLQSSANTNFIIRGFGNGANNPGIEPSVGVFVDGVYRSRTAAQIGDLPDVQRVEVLRGPQSTLFGKNASAGVISMVTREPSFDFKGSVEASYGNYDALVLKGYVTGPISDKVAASIAGGINKRDGYITDLGYNGTANERDRWFVRGQLRIEPSDVLKVRLIADYDKINEVCCAVVNVRRSAATTAIEALGGKVNNSATPFAGVSYSNFPSTNDIQNWGLSGQIDYQVGPLKLTSISAYRSSSNLTNQDSDFTSGDLIGQNRGDVNIDTLTQELRLNASFLDVADLMIGGFYFDEHVKYNNALTYGTQFRPYANLLANGAISQVEAAILGVPVGTFQKTGQGIFDNTQMDNQAWSLFGNLDVKLGDKLTLTLGGNYTKDRKDVTTATVSTDTFSALDFVTIGGAVIRSTAIATQVGSLLGVGTANASQIAAFAAAQPTAYGAIVSGSTAYANANATNPAVNSLLGLRALQFLPPFLNIPNAVENGKSRDGKWTWTARLAWELSDTINTYVSYATGFKASSFNLSRDSRPLASDLPALRTAGLALPNLTTGSRYAGPENAKVFELGIKANWGMASANLTLFKQTITGFQSNVFTGTGFALANAGKQSTSGIEFDGTIKATKALSLNVAMVYLDPKYDSFTASAVGDLSGTRPAGIPELSTTVGAQWNQELANGDRVILRGDWHMESEVQITEGLPAFIQRNALGQVISNQPAFDAARPFTREVSEINASITYAMTNGVELSLWGRNLTNNRYLIQIFDSVAQSGSVSAYPNQPRTYGASLRFKW